MLFGPYVERPGAGPMQAFLYAVLDDAIRLIPHAQLPPALRHSESKIPFLTFPFHCSLAFPG